MKPVILSNEKHYDKWNRLKDINLTKFYDDTRPTYHMLEEGVFQISIGKFLSLTRKTIVLNHVVLNDLNI